MKKTVFDLTDEEGRKINLELIRTSYFRRYLLSYSIIIIISILFGMIITFTADFDKDMMLDEGMVMFTLILFVCLITYLFLFKMFDLFKKYYDEKVKK